MLFSQLNLQVRVVALLHSVSGASFAFLSIVLSFVSETASHSCVCGCEHVCLNMNKYTYITYVFMYALHVCVYACMCMCICSIRAIGVRHFLYKFRIHVF